MRVRPPLSASGPILGVSDAEVVRRVLVHRVARRRRKRLVTEALVESIGSLSVPPQLPFTFRATITLMAVVTAVAAFAKSW